MPGVNNNSVRTSSVPHQPRKLQSIPKAEFLLHEDKLLLLKIAHFKARTVIVRSLVGETHMHTHNQNKILDSRSACCMKEKLAGVLPSLPVMLE